MKKTQIFLLLLAFSVMSFVACKNDHDEEDTTDPVLTISSPVSAASISGAVTISGVVTDNESLHEMSIKVTRDNDASELFTSDHEVHDLTYYSFSDTWSPLGVVTDTPVTMTIVVEDHHENKVTQIVHFSVKP